MGSEHFTFAVGRSRKQPRHAPRGGPAIPTRTKWLPPETSDEPQTVLSEDGTDDQNNAEETPMTTTDTAADWMVVAGICDCNHVAISVLDGSRYDHNNIEPDANEVIRIGSEWRPLVVEAATLLHQQRPECRVSPRCTATYAARGSGREQEFELEDAVIDAMRDAFPHERPNS